MELTLLSLMTHVLMCLINFTFRHVMFMLTLLNGFAFHLIMDHSLSETPIIFYNFRHLL